jgi:hypothetical protein
MPCRHFEPCPNIFAAKSDDVMVSVRFYSVRIFYESRIITASL